MTSPLRLLLVCVSTLGIALTSIAPDVTAHAAGITPLPWCAADSFHRAELFLNEMRRLATGRSTDAIQTRSKLDSMPVVSDADVVLVQDEPTCQRASAMLDSVFYSVPHAASVYLVRIGDRYAIYPPDISMGEFGYVIHTDSSFRKIGIGEI